jgi:hypothetical protein
MKKRALESSLFNAFQKIGQFSFCCQIVPNTVARFSTLCRKSESSFSVAKGQMLRWWARGFCLVLDAFSGGWAVGTAKLWHRATPFRGNRCVAVR